MAEVKLAERVASELKNGGKRRIQVGHIHRPWVFASRLFSLMEDTRFITFDFSNGDPVRETLLKYFTGSGLPDAETAFEAGWRSHLTETALVRGRAGIEAAAGLSSLKDLFKGYLFGDVTSFHGLSRILSSFSGILPAVFLLIGYRGTKLFDSRCDDFPPVVALTAGDRRLSHADLLMDSGLMSLVSARECLRENHCNVPVEKVLRASENRAGLVMLYAGINVCFGLESESIWEMLHRVLESNGEFAGFARAAAILAPGFIPSEASSLSGGVTDNMFLLGKKMNLWRGFTVAVFNSPDVRENILGSIGEAERITLLRKGAETVIRLRKRSAVSLGYAAELLFRAGDSEEASVLFEEAAELETREMKRAELYKRALLSGGAEAEKLRFMAELSLFREKAGTAPERIPDYMDPEDFPELSPVLGVSGEMLDQGRHHEAYRLLADFALQGKNNLPVALVEIGCQLLKRNMVESSLNVMKAAAAAAVESGAGWIEAQALEVLVRACNRSGRFREAERASARLMELALDSGNRLKLVTVYNLYANSLILQTRYEKALKVYQSSLRTLEDDSHGLMAVILNNMSVAQRRLFRTEEALGSLMRFVRSAFSQGNLMQASTGYGNMARLFVDLSRFDSAEDCLETMLEFRKLSGAGAADDSVLFISSQVAFAKGYTEEALSLIDEAVRTAGISGNLRRLSLNLLKKGSMLLRLKEYAEASDVLCRAEEVSIKSNSMLNAFIARMKGTAARCFSGCEHPCSILSIKLSGTPEDTHRGEQFYYHWRLTGSRQSLSAAAQFLSRGLMNGLHYHSYLYMLHEIVGELPSSLADAFPLVHNYPSCDRMKGD